MDKRCPRYDARTEEHAPELRACRLIRLDGFLCLDEVMGRDRDRLLLEGSEKHLGQDRTAERLLLDRCTGMTVRLMMTMRWS